MKGRIIALILMLMLMVNGGIFAVQAEYAPPKDFGAPEDLSVSVREDGTERTWQGFDATVSASDELRAFADVVGADDSPFRAAGYNLSDILLQLDYKADNGDWHYKSQWDEDFGYNSNKSMIRIEKGTYSNYAVFDRNQFESISNGEELPADITYFDNHSMEFRTRFLVSYQDSNGTYFSFYSPWSKSVKFSNNMKAEDPDKLINHVPVLKSAVLKKGTDGKPYISIIADKAHEDLRTLNSISGSSVKTEVWLKSGAGEWKQCYSGSFYEIFDVSGMEAYFGLKDNYDAAVFDIKFRYSFDYNSYPAAGKSGIIYSPYSNVISHGMAAYSNASNWAKKELDKASEYDLIPNSLKGADMTRPITREEFAELAVKLYEKTTGKAAEAVSPNPFTDTQNPEILKAFKIGVTTGTSATTFAPKELTNREQVATMLSRTIRIMAAGGDFSTAGAPTFTDQKDISSWALEHVKFMGKCGIIKGTDGKFMPKATTTAQKAAGYATTTREQALAMSVRSFEQFRDTASAAPAAPQAPAENKAAAAPAGGTAEPKTADKWVVGMWNYSKSSENVGFTVLIELKADGTFIKTVATTAGYTTNATSYEGNYTISGSKLVFTNQKKSEAYASSSDELWKMALTKVKDIPVEDEEQQFSKTEKGNLVYNDMEFQRAGL